MRRATPEILQSRFGVAREAGRERALPRVWLGYQPPKPQRTGRPVTELDRRRRPARKAEFLATAWVLAMAGALPGDGDRADWTRPSVRQRDLAGMSNLARTSFSRRLSRFGRRHGKPVPSLNPTYELIWRRRNYAAANSYDLGAALPAKATARRRDPKLYSYPDGVDLKHSPAAPLFDADAPSGYALVPRWVWDSKLPVSANARLVLTYYILMGGLLDTGECHPRQATVAKALGISVKSVYRANQEWIAIGVLRVAHSPVVKHSDGRIERGPQIVVFLPMRMLSHEEAVTEFKRLQAARNRLRAEQMRWWNGVEAIAAARLHEWEGREHSLGAFHHALRKELASAGVPPEVLSLLIPGRHPDSFRT